MSQYTFTSSNQRARQSVLSPVSSTSSSQSSRDSCARCLHFVCECATSNDFSALSPSYAYPESSRPVAYGYGEYGSSIWPNEVDDTSFNQPSGRIAQPQTVDPSIRSTPPYYATVYTSNSNRYEASSSATYNGEGLTTFKDNSEDVYKPIGSSSRRSMKEYEGVSCLLRDCQSKHLFKDKQALLAHQRNVHLKMWWCEIEGCTRTQPFGNKHDLERHQQTKQHRQPGDVLRYKCSRLTCSKRKKEFSRKDKLDEHNQRYHAKYMCALCPEASRSNRFDNREEVSQHIRQAHPEPQNQDNSYVYPGTYTRYQAQTSRPYSENA